MPSINVTTNNTNSYPFWYFLNDSVVITGNLVGIAFASVFILTIIRLDHPTYSVSNLIACNTCLAIGLTCIATLINVCYALKSDFDGIGYVDSFCLIRGKLFILFYIHMYTSLCLKAFNRFRCIVYYTNRMLTSNRFLIMAVSFQWLLTIALFLVIIFTNGVDYDWGSHLCLVPITKIYQFLYIMIIYYICMVFISIIYVYILSYVLRLPLLERYRRKHQIALLRRILVLLGMLTIPGIFSSFLMIRWLFFRTAPPYALKINALFDTLGHTGAVITIFVSHTKIRREYYGRKKIKIINQVKKSRLESCELVGFRSQRTGK